MLIMLSWLGLPQLSLPHPCQIQCCPKLCRYASEAALEQMGDALEEAGKLAETYYEIFVSELRRPACELEEVEEGVEELETGVLHKRVAAPIGGPPSLTLLSYQVH